jgi:hypothetical protein
VKAESHVIVPTGTALYGRLHGLASTQRIIGVAGLPGTGKSLLIHQLAHLAAAQGREVWLLQWDVARPAFEASPAGARYPVIHGVTQGVIRKAVGLWAREAVVHWHRAHPESRHLLLSETPFIGNRLIELAYATEDAAEALLSRETSCFVLPVPSREVRRAIEQRREERSTAPLHPQEAEDAPPQVLRALWGELQRLAPRLGIETLGKEGTYDPEVYRRVYEMLLRHRRCEVLAIETLLPTGGMSPYTFAEPRRDLVPTRVQAEAWIEAVERQYPDLQALQQELEAWYEVAPPC